MFTDSKLIIAGDFIEIFKYGRKIWHGSLPQSKPASGERRKAKEGKRSKTSFLSAKGNLKRQINANAWQWFNEKEKVFIPIFFTLTFAENITDTEQANYEFTKFIQRFNYEMGYKKSYLKYSVVKEFQKRGAIHYHFISYNMPFIKDLKNKLLKLWGNGFTNYRKIRKGTDVGSYMSKYMGKEFDDSRLFNKKCFFSSRGLKKKIVKNDPSVTNFVLHFLPESAKIYEDNYPSDYCKSLHYRKYNLTKEQDLKSTLLAFIKQS
jgi:hypothetical protein